MQISKLAIKTQRGATLSEYAIAMALVVVVFIVIGDKLMDAAVGPADADGQRSGGRRGQTLSVVENSVPCSPELAQFEDGCK